MKQALLEIGRQDLIGEAEDCLIPSIPPRGARTPTASRLYDNRRRRLRPSNSTYSITTLLTTGETMKRVTLVIASFALFTITPVDDTWARGGRGGGGGGGGGRGGGGRSASRPAPQPSRRANRCVYGDDASWLSSEPR